MNITLDAELEAALQAAAEKQGVAPEALALSTLRQRFAPPVFEPRDEWERELFEAAIDCGVTTPDWALTAEGLYD
ncbi:MAG TPA: hypothetical protein VN641_22590 [Urbifossiella sp.]|nr:hypothetical protein [Urbifossiella sp.]